MKSLIFVTSNSLKFKEAKAACDMFDINIQQRELDIEEIQSSDPRLVSTRKAELAFKTLKKPLVVTDINWDIPSLKGFPGPYMKYIVNWFTQEDFLNLMRDKSDKRISFTDSITYKDRSQIKNFSKVYWGNFVDKPRGSGNSIENVVEFEGYTLGERRKQGGFSHKPEDYTWVNFAKWYIKK